MPSMNTDLIQVQLKKKQVYEVSFWSDKNAVKLDYVNCCIAFVNLQNH